MQAYQNELIQPLDRYQHMGRMPTQWRLVYVHDHGTDVRRVFGLAVTISGTDDYTALNPPLLVRSSAACWVITSAFVCNDLYYARGRRPESARVRTLM